MDKKLVKQITCKKSEIEWVLSENGKAIFIVGLFECLRVVKTDIDYSGDTVILDFVARTKQIPLLEFQEVNKITLNDDKDRISFGGFEMECAATSIDFYDGFENPIIIPGDLIPVIQKVGLSVSLDDSRYFMKGIFFAKNGDIVSTDAHRLTLKKSPLTFGDWIVRPEAFKYFKGKSDVILEYKCIVTKDDKGFENKTEYLKLRDNENIVITTLIQGQFPNYMRVVPEVSNLEQHYISGMKNFKVQEKVYKSDNPRVKIAKGDLIRPALDNIPEIKFGSISGFDKDEVYFNGEYLKDIFTQFGDEMPLWLPVKCTGVESGLYDNKKCHLFGNISDFFTVVMPLQ